METITTNHLVIDIVRSYTSRKITTKGPKCKSYKCPIITNIILKCY